LSNFCDILSRLVLIVVVAGVIQVKAGEVKEASVTYEKGVYRLVFNVVIDAELNKVRTIVTDYPHLYQLSQMLTQSTLMDTPKDQPPRRLLVAHVCWLIFCREIRAVEDIETANDVINTRLVPEQCDFKSGSTRWQLSALAERSSRIEFTSDLQPDFWIPPVIGPLLVKRRLMKEALLLIDNIETVASAHD